MAKYTDECEEKFLDYLSTQTEYPDLRIYGKGTPLVLLSFWRAAWDARGEYEEKNIGEKDK
jgi:hypothetical protein